MSATAWYVWSAGRAGGIFASSGSASRHCYLLTNDHRVHKEIQQIAPDVWRYVGPRGRRHGTRLVAFIGTRVGLEELGLNMTALDGLITRAG